MLDMSGLWAVLIFMILVPGVVIGYGIFLHHERAVALARSNPKKRTVVPQKAYEQPGICQCDDGFNFHIDGKRCNVEGCPCVVYIPSTAEPETLREIELVGVSRLAIESANSQQEALAKLQRLEESKTRVASIQAPPQIGPKNSSVTCEVCGRKGHAWGANCPNWSR